MRGTLTLILACMALACGGTRDRPPGTNPANTPACDACLALEWGEVCFPEPVDCEPGAQAECWDAAIACVEGQAPDEAQCWRSCTGWPNAPFPEAAEEIECRAACESAVLGCYGAATSTGAFDACSDTSSRCQSACAP